MKSRKYKEEKNKERKAKLKEKPCVKKPAKKSLVAKPCLVMFYKASGKAAIRNCSSGKQLFQFGGSQYDEEDLRTIAKNATARMLNRTIDASALKQFVDDEVSNLIRNVD